MAAPHYQPEVQQGYYLDADTNQYLALYGASELFGQLAQTEPRPKRAKRERRGKGRKRRDNYAFAHGMDYDDGHHN